MLPECFEVDSKQKEFSKTLNIARLSPFIEEDGTIRVKGRLKHSNLDYNAKHPTLLTAKHPVVQLLLEKAHRDNLHEGTEYVRNKLQQKKYWIIGLRNAIRKIKSRCFKCRHRNANPIHPPMQTYPEKYLMNICSQPYRSRLLPTLRSQVPTKYHEEMVLPRHWPDNESSAHRSCTVIGHRVMSSCSDKIHCKSWLPQHHHQ